MLCDNLALTREAYENPMQWVSIMPDGKELDLRDGLDEDDRLKVGESNNVAYEHRLLFARQALKSRLLHSSAQVKAIRKGMSEVVPQAFLNIGTHEELETWVCGRSCVDIELLKRHTTYGGNDPDYAPDS